MRNDRKTIVAFMKNKTGIVFFVMGVISTIWFLIRVIPKPSRATYPCMQTSAPIMSAFIIYITSIATSYYTFKSFKEKLKISSYLTALIFLFASVVFAGISIVINPDYSFSRNAASIFSTQTPVVSHVPIGIARGLNPGRVTWSHNPSATLWDGTANSHWWDSANNNQAAINELLSNSIKQLMSEKSDIDAWSALFRYHNKTHGKGEFGYTVGEKIVIKINQNTARNGYFENGTIKTSSTDIKDWNQNSINASPKLIFALLSQLVNAGVPQADITVYDASRTIPDNIFIPNHTAFPNVHFMDNTGGRGIGGPENNREKVIWSTSNRVSYAKNNGLGGKLPMQVLNAKYMINLAIMKNHNHGPTLCAKNHYGSIGGVVQGQTKPQGDHKAIFNEGRLMNTYANVVELMGHKDLGEKTLLFLVDALYGSQNPDARPAKWGNWVPFNGGWPASIFASQDAVAIESVCYDFVNRQWGIAENGENYLHEAALANNPPSGIKYMPNGDSIQLKSLGVHEHWNNDVDKKYSRNLGTGKGIELQYFFLGI